MIASRIASLIWSHILSGCPSVTDSDVNRYSAASRIVVMELPLCSGRVARAPSSTGLRVPPTGRPVQSLRLEHEELRPVIAVGRRFVPAHVEEQPDLDELVTAAYDRVVMLDRIGPSRPQRHPIAGRRI